MLVILIIILVLLGAAVVGSIYSNFTVFYSNFSETENYHKAYYASISALERGELVTKQRQPGYVGSGGFITGNGVGIFNNGGSDKSLSGFSYFGTNTGDTSVFWTINSRATRIPTTGKGDVERLLAYENPNNLNDSENSNNYNMMNYEMSEVFLLYYDNSDNNPYTNGTIIQSTPNQITGEIRLPKLLSSTFGNLDTGNSSVGMLGSLPNDDSIVDRQIKGHYYNNPFTIYSTQRIDQGGIFPRIIYQSDSAFRESDINKILKFKFGNGTSKSPIEQPTNRGNNINSLTIISQEEDNIKTSSFSTIFLNSTGVQLKFSLLNELKGTGTNIYPFLEYYIDFGGKYVSDKYYTINGEGTFKDYTVNTIIQKPTVKESVLGSFTSIF